MDNFEDFTEDAQQELVEQMVREKERAFISGCIDGFDLLEKHGEECLQGVDPDSTKEALQRMIGYFISIEEYEKCTLIQNLYVGYYKEEITPRFPNF